MKIAFYAPLKSPNHGTPSGDRLMARQLIAALEMIGHRVSVASELRAFTATLDEAVRAGITAQAEAEVARLLALPAGDLPDLWFTYHTYYKTPDQIGPAVAAALGIPYVTAEASYSVRQDGRGWRDNQRLVADGVRQAAVNLCFTERDRQGLIAAIPGAVCARLLPFIDPGSFRSAGIAAPARLVTVAMMRDGDKLDSYVMLARALDLLRGRDWTLTVIGDGPKEAEVQALFAGFPVGKISWLGRRSAGEIAAELAHGGIYVWPGCGEAYGLAYLEAQAAGLPVIAQATAGVPEVVVDGVTGLLTPDGNIHAFAAAIIRLLDDDDERRRMGASARRFVLEERSLDAAARRLDEILRQHLGERYE